MEIVSDLLPMLDMEDSLIKVFVELAPFRNI